MNNNIKSFFNAGIVVSAIIILWPVVSGYKDTITENERYNQAVKARYAIYPSDLPSEIDFCGIKVPLDKLDVREGLDREILVNMYWQSNMLLYLKRSGRWFPLIEKILKEEGIPDDFKYLAVIESGLMQAVSPSGAAGFWQIMKATGPELGLEVNTEVDERYNVEKSTYAACKYFKKAYERFNNDWVLVAASYNMGMAGLDRQITQQKVSSYYDLWLNQETARYVYRILAVKMIFQSMESFGFHMRASDYYVPYDVKEVSVSGAVSSLADFAIEQGTTYKMIKTLNPWLVSTTLTNKAAKTYKILIPSENFNNQPEFQAQDINDGVIVPETKPEAKPESETKATDSPKQPNRFFDWL